MFSLFFFYSDHSHNLTDSFEDTSSCVGEIVLAFYSVLYSYEGWLVVYMCNLTLNLNSRNATVLCDDSLIRKRQNFLHTIFKCSVYNFLIHYFNYCVNTCIILSYTVGMALDIQ